MKRVSLSSHVIVAVIAWMFLAHSSVIFGLKIDEKMTPGLEEEGLRLNISQQTCMDRARDALSSAGLTLQTPSSSARGGINRKAFAIISCVPCSDQLYVNIAVASAPNYNDNHRLVFFLRDYMNNGLNSPGAAGTSAGGSATSSGANTGSSVCKPFEGLWNTSYTPITFQRDGNQVTGSYTFQQIACSLNGTLSGNVLEGEYSQPNDSDPKYQHGRLRFELNPDGQSWTGEWWDANGVSGGAWNGTCAGNTSDPSSTAESAGTSQTSGSVEGNAANSATSVGTNVGSTRAAGSECKPFEGQWNTNYAPVTLQRRDNQVTGSYTFQQIACSLNGTLSGNVLEGEYSQPNYPDPRLQRGRFKFVMNPDGQSWTGEWWDANGVSGGAWNGTCAGNTSDPSSTRGSSGSDTAGTGAGNAGVRNAGGICDNPQILAIMDQWLFSAKPLENQKPGYNLRYEAWGRLVGTTPSTALSVAGQPDTDLTRCEWLWQQSGNLHSTNLGTLREYVQRQGQ